MLLLLHHLIDVELGFGAALSTSFALALSLTLTLAACWLNGLWFAGSNTL